MSYGPHGCRVNVYRRGRYFSAAYRVDGIPIQKSLKTAQPEEAAKKAEAIVAKLVSGNKNGERLAPVLYVIQRGEKGPIKIGLTGNLKARIRSLKVAVPEEIRLIAAYTIADIERSLHQKLSGFRLDGEWFSVEAKERIRELLPRQYALNRLKKYRAAFVKVPNVK